MRDHSELLTALDYEFKDKQLLFQALTHRSHSANHNERLEFLGDAVLQLVITDYLYQNYPKLSEGHLSRIRASLVSSNGLVAVAAAIDLSDYIMVGKCERQGDGQMRSSIVANTVEALIAAVYMDGSYEAAKKVVLKIFAIRLDADLSEMETKDGKSRLQEWAQAKGLPRPEYKGVDSSGAQHRKSFKMSCAIPGILHAEIAISTSRQKAEMLAAEKLYKYLKEQDGRADA